MVVGCRRGKQQGCHGQQAEAEPTQFGALGIGKFFAKHADKKSASNKSGCHSQVQVRDGMPDGRLERSKR